MKSSRLWVSVSAVLLTAAVSSSGYPGDKSPTKHEPGRTTVPRLVLQEPQKPAEEASPEKKLSPREMKVMRGDIYMARKMYVEAVAVYQDLLREEPRNAELLNKVGVAYHLQSRLGDAKKYYKRAVKADKEFATAYNNLGMVEYHRKKYKNAIKEFRRALKLDSTVATYEHNLFHAYWSSKKYDEALLAFQRAVALDPLVFERRSASAGSVLQSLPLEQRPAYYFFMAKSYAMVGDVARCALYLAKARDEGYPELARVQKDPVFAVMIQQPQVMEVLGIQPVATTKPKP